MIDWLMRWTVVAWGVTDTLTGSLSSSPASFPISDEAEVQHLVGLVEDEDLGAGQVQRLLLHVVQQAAGGGDQHVEAGLDGAFLRAVFHAAEDDCDLEAEVTAIGLEAFGDLAGQFAGRRQDEDAGGARLGRDAVGGEAVQDRQGEGRRLAGAGLGDAQKVLAGHDVRNGLGLDRGGGGVAFGGQRLQQGRIQAEGVECLAHVSHVFRMRRRASTGLTSHGPRTASPDRASG
jgi:hypothetical protein